jgi:alpha-L-fucosidase
MIDYSYVEKFRERGFGIFHHFGLYSLLGEGEWYKDVYHADNAAYEGLIHRFDVDPLWAKRLAKTAKEAGARYITLTTRHHEGFSLYDTCGLNDFDAPHSASHRDLVKEFVEACHEEGLLPVFYHTVIDWHNPDYLAGNFPAYFAYLEKSIEILCKNYGPIGGIWFDGTWGLPKGIVFPKRIYERIHALQPQAIITNNTGLSCLGEQGEQEIDAVTFERGKPFPVEGLRRPIVGEVCDSLTDHWGYAKNDISTKSAREILSLLIDCRANGANLLLNSGLQGNGLYNSHDEEVLQEVGLWLRTNQSVILDGKPSSLKGSNATLFEKNGRYYAVIKNVPMTTNANVTRMEENCLVKLETKKKITDAIWLDNGEKLTLRTPQSFLSEPFRYGVSLCERIASFTLE